MSRGAEPRSAAVPRVVVGMPVHNSERFLGETLASVAAQDYPNLEVVISDDASTDGTLSLCETFARRHPWVRVVRHSRRLGWVGNYNSLLPHATGEYFLWVPHDDLYAPTYVSELVACLEQRPDAVAAYSETVGIGEAGRAIWGWPRAAALGRGGSRLRRALRYLWASEGVKFIPFRGVFRSASVHAGGGLRPGPGEFAADDLWLFCLSLLGAFVYCPRPLCRKRLSPESTSRAHRHTLPAWLAYLDDHHPVVRAARLPWHESLVLHASIALRRVWITAWWLSRRAGLIRVAARVGWYCSPAQMPRRLRALRSHVAGWITNAR